jgi:deoxyribonuclease V
VRIAEPHRWDLTVAEARALQERLRRRVRHDPLAARPRLVAGVDVTYPEGSGAALAAVVVVRLPSLAVVESALGAAPAPFPYVPGYLSFREGPAALAALRRLRAEPDLLLCDGQGLAHPRRFGLACHLGVILDRPAVGCAKSLLVGSHAVPGARRGCRRRILDRGETVGVALRTRDGVRPVYVSVGHRVDLPGAIRVVLACARGFRHPEPLRLAHRLVVAAARG